MAHRTDTGAAMPYWPTPDPVDPDAFLDPPNNLWTAAARREARVRRIARRVAFWAGLLGLIAGLYLSLRPAEAQQRPCHSRADVVEALREKHSEVQRVFGLMPNGRLLEVFVSPSGGWTMVVTHPNGFSCVTGAGEHFEVLPVATKDPLA